MHEHCHCEHKNLKYRSVCNVVYCVDCKQEWHQDSYTTSWTNATPCSSGTTAMPLTDITSLGQIHTH